MNAIQLIYGCQHGNSERYGNKCCRAKRQNRHNSAQYPVASGPSAEPIAQTEVQAGMDKLHHGEARVTTSLLRFDRFDLSTAVLRLESMQRYKF